MRTPFAIGKRTGTTLEIAVLCMQCREWIRVPESDHDRVSHGLHPECVEDYLREAVES